MALLGFNVIAAQQTLDLLHGICRHLELPGQHPAQFLDYHLTCHQLMLSKDEPQNICAQSARPECACEHVGIGEDPHDTRLKTSSSVRYPRASANGITRRRSCSKRS